MADLSPLAENFRLGIDIVIQPWFRDHYFAGKVILPAVETMLILAGEVKKNWPGYHLATMFEARFAKFLEIGLDDKKIAAIIEFSDQEDDTIIARLLTRISKKKISRLIEHGRVSFKRAEICSFSPIAQARHAEPVFKISAQKIYSELVPFGPAYQNIIDDLYLNEQGVQGRVKAPGYPVPDIAGSPFPLDAALHAACVWGQRFGGFVPFPVGFSRRRVSIPTIPGNVYEIRVIPLEIKTNELFFDLWILDSSGELFESVEGLNMRDVSGGAVKPPAWFSAL